MISVEEADRLVVENVPSPQSERIDTANATGRVLQESVKAERDAPPFDRVMMDGYAIQYQEFLSGEFDIKGIALAGHPPPNLEQETDCIEVTTGSPLPQGTNVIVPVEDCICEGTMMRLRAGVSPRENQYIHSKGSDGLAGREVLPTGITLGPPELAILATEGVSEVTVSKVPRIVLVTTGDEIVLDGSEVRPEQIRGSHMEALRSLFIAFPGIEFSRVHAADEEDDLKSKLEASLARADIVLITGGVSRGRKDLVPGMLKELGVKQLFHRVCQRPGKPLWFGKREETLVFGLPGNPISTLISARRYVFPVLEKWMGENLKPALRLPVAGVLEALNEFYRFIPVCIGAGGLEADPFATSGSLHSLAGTAGFVEVPPIGESADQFNFYPWNCR